MSLMRSALLWASTNPLLSEKLPRMSFVKRAARRFMPGEEVEAALAEAEKLDARGVGTILTLLGENVEDASDAQGVTDHYVKVLGLIREKGLDCEISVKPTQLGLDLATEVALEHLRTLVDAARGDLVWIDMEASEYVDRTLDMYRAVRGDGGNVGVCLQAYLHRTPDDLESLMPLEPHIRLVKGAYMEPPEVAIQRKREVDAAFAKLTTGMLRAANFGDMGRLALGSHDSNVVNHAMTRAHELVLDPDKWEVQMLYGIGTDLQARVARGEANLRVLISYGEQWFPWYMRRLAERPANVWFVMRKMLGG